jgi:hypothetical protein
MFEERFKRDVLARFDRAEAAMPHYKFKIIRDMIDKHGGVQTAKRLLDLTYVTMIQYGLDALAENGLLDCSIEQAVIDHEVSGEFTPAEIAAARGRLMILKRKHR